MSRSTIKSNNDGDERESFSPFLKEKAFTNTFRAYYCTSISPCPCQIFPILYPNRLEFLLRSLPIKDTIFLNKKRK